VLLVFLVGIQLAFAGETVINLITSYDEALRNNKESIPGVDALVENIYKSSNLTSQDDTNELVKVLKMTSDSPSWLDSGKLIITCTF
jgi:hypothetical protein